jgi:hypothetical protein
MKSCIDWMCLAMMSFTAPWVAVCMDAILVFQRKGNIYNSYAW